MILVRLSIAIQLEETVRKVCTDLPSSNRVTHPLPRFLAEWAKIEGPVSLVVVYENGSTSCPGLHQFAEVSVSVCNDRHTSVTTQIRRRDNGQMAVNSWRDVLLYNLNNAGSQQMLLWLEGLQRTSEKSKSWAPLSCPSDTFAVASPSIPSIWFNAGSS